MTNKAKRVYTLIQDKAGSNELMQGISGFLGFPFTLIADAGVIFTHYGPMLNEIRRIYGCSSLSSDVIAPIINGCKSEILADVIVDKLIGQIPVLGIGANIMCAKAMTWRLGLLFAMLSARGEDISTANVVDCTRLIRKMFPQTNMFKFRTPPIAVVEKLLDSAEGADPSEFDSKVAQALSVFD